MATFRSTFSFLIRNHRPSFSNPPSQRRNPPFHHRAAPSFVSAQRSHPSFYALPLPNPRFGNLTNRKGLFCYRCRCSGHYARACNNLVRCFACGELGHKRFNCGKTRATISTHAKNSGYDLDDDSWLLEAAQILDSGDCVDPMLLDPNVKFCSLCHNVDLVDLSKASAAEFRREAEPTSVVHPELNSMDLEGTPRVSGLIVIDGGNRQRANIVKGVVGVKCRPGGIRFSFRMSEWLAAKLIKYTPRCFPIRVSLEVFLHCLTVPYSSARDGLGALSYSCKLSDIKIIDRIGDVCSFVCLGESQGVVTIFIKPYKFILYCFLAAFRHQAALLPPVASWKAQLSLKSFICSSPNNANADKCIFGTEKVFSKTSPAASCKKKLPFSESIRHSPRLSRRSRSGAP